MNSEFMSLISLPSDKLLNLIQHEFKWNEGRLVLSNTWLVTIRDVAPYIGLIVLAGIVLFIIYVIIKWSQYWTKKAFEEYERENPDVTRGVKQHLQLS